MKVSILKFTVLGCIITAGIISCTNSHETKVENAEQKVEDAKAEVVEAKEDLEQARLNSAEYVRYKEETEARLKENDRKITELKGIVKSESKELGAEYEKQLEELHQQNAKLKARIQEQKEGSSNKWESFQQEFNQEMTDLNKKIAAIAEKSRK